MISLPRMGMAALAAMALGACGSGASDSKGRAAKSEVLQGSVSDEMIAYDRLTSEPPRAQIEEDEESADGAGSGEPAPSGQAASGPETPAPVASPTPEAAAPAEPAE